MENLKFLRDNLFYTGFGETLHEALEKAIETKQPEFQLNYSAQINNKPFEAVLDFRKSNTSDMYFFNRYKASTTTTAGEKVAQAFTIERGKGVTVKEAYNLLQGRAVRKELTSAKGQEYNAWIQLDFSQKDDKGNYKLSRYNDNYGFDLLRSLEKFPILELDGSDKQKDLLRSLERGNLQVATIENGDSPIKVFVEANPAERMLNVYDEHLQPMQQERLPLSTKATEQMTQQAASTKQEPGGQKQKDQALLTKKRTGQRQGNKIS